MIGVEYHAAIRTRILLFYVFVAGLVLVLFCGLAYRQLFSVEAFQERERLQNQRRILNPGPRGEIFDREGRVLVANRPRFSAVLNFSEYALRKELRETEIRLRRDIRDGQIEDPGERTDRHARALVVQKYLTECSRILGRPLTIERKKLERHFNEQPLLPFSLINDLSQEEFSRLLEQLRPGSPVQLLPATARHYPYASAAAHTLGYIGSTDELPTEGLQGSDLQTFIAKGMYGRDGLEKQFDSLLQGQTGYSIWIVDPNGIQDRMVSSQTPVAGKPLFTSLDIDLQMKAEEVFGDQSGALVLIDVHTGEILAMVSKPDFDLNETSPFIPATLWNRLNEQEALYNRCTAGLYPPGSTFKIITASAGLRHGAITTDTEFECPGYFMLGRFRFVCHRRSGHGAVRVTDALRMSCNVFFYETAMRLGPEKLAEEGRRFGLHLPTGIELPAEATKMIMPDPAWKKAVGREAWTAGNTANMAIGQGDVLVTPLQMACLAASYARNETTTTPTILRRDRGARVPIRPNQPIGLRPEHRAAIVEGMFQVVDWTAAQHPGQAGTGSRAKLAGINLAGKTGTAQIKTLNRGTFELAWFVGFGPLEDPRVAWCALVIGDQPDEEMGGGAVAAPKVKPMLELYFQKHPPEPPPPASRFAAPVAR
jgi:penicillin-binding protein 2